MSGSQNIQPVIDKNITFASSQIGMPCGQCLTEVSRSEPLSVQQATLDDHSEVVPPLPIPNRTVKRLSADDSADSRVKVGHRQAIYAQRPEPVKGSGHFSYFSAVEAPPVHTCPTRGIPVAQQAWRPAGGCRPDPING